MTRRQANWWLGLVLLVYSLLGLAHTIWLPLHKAPDEIAHFQYSRFIAQKGRLPVNYEERQEAGFKSDWPALYHAMIAALTGWSDSDGPPYLKFVWESPRFEMARTLLDTKRLANSEDELMPYRGAVLMWHLGRVVSILLGAGIIIVAFFTTLEVFPGKFHLAVVSAAIIAFIPTFIFICSAMSDDPLVGLIIGFYFWLLIKIVKGDNRPSNYLGLGILMGLAATTKYSTVILPAQIVIVVTYLAWRGRWRWWNWCGRIALIGGAAMLAASWWFLWIIINFHEIDKYGPWIGLLKPLMVDGIDPSQKYVAFMLTGGEIGTAESPDIVPEPFWAWLLQIYQSFWVFKIGNYPLGLVPHLLIGLVSLMTLVGLIRIWRRQPNRRVWISLFLLQVILFLIFPFVRFLILGHIDQSAQGRHVLFPIATVLPLMIVFSWQGWLSSQTQKWLALAIIGGLVCWSLAQAVRVVTFYPPPLPIRTTADAVNQISKRLDKRFGENLVLLGYNLQIEPELNTLNLSLFWQSPTYADEDYSMEVHVVRDGVAHLRWSAFPLNGRYPTRIWESWETIRDDLSFPLIDIPPGTYEIQLQLNGYEGPVPVDGLEALTVTQVVLPDTPMQTILNLTLPMVVDGQELEIDFSLWQAEDYRELGLPKYGPRMAIPLVWQGQLPDQVRLQWLLVDPQGQVNQAHSASPHFEYFLVGLDWPSGDYRLRAELWQGQKVVASRETGPVVTIFNEYPRRLQIPSMAQPIWANFANRVKLMGYDLPDRTLAPGQGVPITLYWQGMRTMEQSYTIFTKLLDSQQQLWASSERLPADGYSTIYWLDDEVVADSFELPIPDSAVPTGIYWLNVGLYEEIDNEAVSLPIVIDGRESEETSVTFGPIKIGGSPPSVVLATTEVLPDIPLAISFGHPPTILLHGYDFIQKDDTLRIRLYWESLAQTPVDWSVFIHVRNNTGQLVAQKDGPIGTDRYPVSLWEVGEIVADKFVVPLTNLSSGNYDVVIGLYDLSTGERLPVAGHSDDELLLEKNVKMGQ